MGADASTRGAGEELAVAGTRLTSSPAVLRAVMQNARTLIVGVRRDGSWYPISPALTTVLGYAEDDADLVSLLDLVHPNDQLRAAALFGAASLSPALTPPVDLRLRAASGKWLVLETVASGQLDDPGIGAVVFYGRDVTGLRDTEHALRAAKAELQGHNRSLTELARQKNEFVASLSHELRSPLTVIVSFAHLLADPEQGDLNAQQLKFVEVINRNAGRIARHLDDLMLLARIESGRLPLTTRSGSPADLVATAVADHEPVADAAGIELRCEVRPGPPAEFDEVRLHQALGNVLGNALKFSGAGDAVSVWAGADASGWRIEVADSGIGVPDGEHEDIFMPFVRGSNAGKAGLPGSGLGLVVSRAILEMHGGTLELESREGQGTTVTIRLPLAPHGGGA